LIFTNPSKDLEQRLMVNDRLPLRTAPRKGSDPAEFDKYIDAIAHDAVDKLVYEVETILDKRQVDGHTEYKVKWQGYGRRQATWEPEYNLTNYGAAQMIKDFEMKFADAALVIAMFSNGEPRQEDAKIGVQRKTETSTRIRKRMDKSMARRRRTDA